LRDHLLRLRLCSTLKIGKARAIRFSIRESICALDCQPAGLLESVPDSSGAAGTTASEPEESI
jgi:DNA-binding Xre family transcriptional regulator